ncbi:unnamed protein product [Caenorhabditis sp. 36 PRJEB53466]|nr:unnamed protein product [Caenorhabditis sp. 36 PRJEB53466]
MFASAQELPFAAVLSKQYRHTYCATCFSLLSEKNYEVLTCDDCLDVCYCSLKCQRKDWNSVHQSECGILRSQKESYQLTVTMRLCIRTLLQSLRSYGTESFNRIKLDDLESNYTDFRSSSEHNQFISDILAIIRTTGQEVIPRHLDNDKLLAVICTVMCNAFSIISEKKLEPIGTGLYLGLAMHNHSCASTAHVVFERNKAVLRSAENNYSTSTTISYVSRMLPTAERRKSIRKVHFLTCLSSRCQEPYCFGVVTNSICGKCGGKSSIAHEEVEKCTSKLISILDKLHTEDVNSYMNDGDRKTVFGNEPSYSPCTREQFDWLEKIRARYSEVLADCNVGMLLLDEQIAYVLSSIPRNDLPENFRELAIKGCDHFIFRLKLGSPEP